MLGGAGQEGSVTLAVGLACWPRLLRVVGGALRSVAGGA
jgi:hypothetical protein